MTFCTAINCMDGRVQLPVNTYLKERFKADFVDTITEAGPNLILSEGSWNRSTRAIIDRLTISIDKHNSVGIAIVGHHDCAGNPVSKDEQIIHIKMAIRSIKREFVEVEVIGLWVDDNWVVHELV